MTIMSRIRVHETVPLELRALLRGDRPPEEDAEFYVVGIGEMTDPRPGLPDELWVARSAVVEALGETERRYEDLFGGGPECDVHLVVSSSPTDARIGDLDGRPVFLLNLRVLRTYGPRGIRVVLAHEVFHMLQMERLGVGSFFETSDAPLPSSLYGEGQATFATTLVWPAFPEWLSFALRPEEYEACRRVERRIARRLLDLWDTRDEQTVAGFFQAGAESATGLPVRCGYYMGLVIGKTLSRTMDPVAVALLRAGEWIPLARAALDERA